MAAITKLKYFQLVRAKLSPLKLTILALFYFLLLPSHPFNGENGHLMEAADQYKSKEISELLQIYSVLKSQSGDLKDAWAWSISKAIIEESRKHALDPMLVLAVINVESSFQSAAVSPEGARGLMQINPSFANALAQEADIERWEGEQSLDDPILNIKLGVFYLQSLKQDFRDIKLALTAYNWGPTEIKSRLQEDDALPFEYAMKVLSAYQSYRKESR